METPVRIDKKLLDEVDAEAGRLGLTRQKMINVLVRVSTSYLKRNGYEKTLMLEHEAKQLGSNP